MDSILKDIQKPVIKYADIISNIIGVDVEIVDQNMIRIAGTGIYKSKINKNMAKEGYVYRTVLLSGKPRIIYCPGKEEICTSCPKKNNCEEKFEMSTPIVLNNKAIGVIGLVCSNNVQKKHLMSNFKVYMEFLEQMSEFIAMTAYQRIEILKEKTLVKLLNIVINNVEQCVIILDKNNRIKQINNNALKELNLLNDNCMDKTLDLYLSDDNVFDMQEYKISIDNLNFYVVGNLYPVELDEEKFNRIFIFNDSKYIKAKYSKYANSYKKITSNDILGESSKMQILKNDIKKISTSKSTVLVTGESGTGKEMVARAIHNEGNRRDKPFVAINCGAIPDALLESELFGYVKGAFTGANPMGKMGKFELANKGTIFLDEIGDMPIYLQTKLLRVIQERKITRIGSNKIIDIDVRIIAATNKNLIKLIRENKFRKDLYYRLNVLPIEIPPLRERIVDIKILLNAFIEKYTGLLNKKFSELHIDKKVYEIFYSYPWPGNVRELENTVEFMINMVGTDGVLDLTTIPNSIKDYNNKNMNISDDICTLKDLEKKAIKKALNLYGTTTEGKKIIASKLGIGIATLYRKISEYNLS